MIIVRKFFPASFNMINYSFLDLKISLVQIILNSSLLKKWLYLC